MNLLEHTTGFDDNSFKGYANNDPTPLTLRQGLDLDSATHVSRWRPGTRVSYCNTGPAIAAYIVEKLEGKPFETVVQERLFGPLGMATATYFFPDTARLSVATLYKGDGKTAEPYWHVFIRPAGSINASALDMAHYVRFLLNRGAVNGSQLLPAAAIERLERSEASLEASSGLPVGYGKHIGRYTDSTGFVWTGHDGGVNGGVTNMAYIPELGVGYAFMINTSSGEAYEQISRLLREYLVRDQPRPTPPPPGVIHAETRAEYSGWYRPDNPRIQHAHFVVRILGLQRVAVDDSALVLRRFISRSPGRRYLPVQGMHFRQAHEPVATLALIDDSANGRERAIEAMGYLLPSSYVRIPAAQAWGELGLAGMWVAGILLTLLAAVLAPLRWLIRVARGRVREASVTRGMWRMAIATTLAFATGFLMLFSMAMTDDLAIGTASARTVGGWLFLLAFAALAALSVVAAFRRIAPEARPRRLSLTAVRAVAILNFLAAAYMTYWGFIGWRTWV